MTNVEKFLANNTKGFEARKELYEIISNELYSIFFIISNYPNWKCR